MRLIFALLSLFCLGFIIPEFSHTDKTLQVLSKSNTFHDPASRWNQTLLNFHIEEPRIGNPTRYSEILLNVADGTFSLVRNREDHLTTYSMDANNKPLVLLDGNEQIDEEQRARYRLYPDRVADYRDFYRLMYGLPMSIDYKLIRKLYDIRSVNFLGSPSLMIEIAWEKPIIKPVWKLYLDPDTYHLKGIDLTDSDAKTGERVVMEGLVDYNGLKIPRMRHWYKLENNDYLGSDIIIEKDRF